MRFFLIGREEIREHLGANETWKYLKQHDLYG
jgi:hypothetical protein